MEPMPSYGELSDLCQRQAAQIAQLTARVGELEEQLQAAHRQTAPFRRRKTAKKPPAQHKRPGRPKGHAAEYRRRPTQIDQKIEVPLEGCPNCHGVLSDVRACEQIIEEIPPTEPVRINRCGSS